LIFLLILVVYVIVTRSTLNLAGGKSQQFTILNLDTILTFYKPKPPLSKFVDNFWLYEGYEAEGKTERILPTGTLELVINLRQNELQFLRRRTSFDGRLVARLPPPRNDSFGMLWVMVVRIHP